jgi:hypothetical protein
MIALSPTGRSRLCRDQPISETSEEARLKHRDIFQQGNHAEDDHDHAHDLLGAAVERQQVDQIKNENNDEKSNECTY